MSEHGLTDAEQKLFAQLRVERQLDLYLRGDCFACEKPLGDLTVEIGIQLVVCSCGVPIGDAARLVSCHGGACLDAALHKVAAEAKERLAEAAS